MVNKIRKIKNEKGQTLVEFAIVLPIFIFLLFFIIDVAWVTFQTISFDYGYRQASWEISVDDPDLSRTKTYSGSYVNNLLKTNILTNANDMISNNLFIYDGSIFLWSDIVTEKYPGYTYGDYEYYEHYMRYMRIRAYLWYRIEPLTPIGKLFFGNNFYQFKNLDKERLNQKKLKDSY